MATVTDLPEVLLLHRLFLLLMRRGRRDSGFPEPKGNYFWTESRCAHGREIVYN